MILSGAQLESLMEIKRIFLAFTLSAKFRQHLMLLSVRTTIKFSVKFHDQAPGIPSIEYLCSPSQPPNPVQSEGSVFFLTGIKGVAVDCLFAPK
jgi:hypothetical protein